MEESAEDIIYYLAALIIGAVVTLGGKYLVNVLGEGKKSEKEIKIAEIGAETKEYIKTKEDLHKALEAIKDLKTELNKEKEIKFEVQRKFEAVKLAFKIIYNQYARQFKDDPDQLDMLAELKDIIEE